MADFLFDIGKVLLDFDFAPSLSTIIPSTNQEPALTLTKLLAKKDQFETGRISAGDYTAWAIGILGAGTTPARFETAWRDIFTKNHPMWETAASLHSAGHRLILFSNTNAIHCPWIFQAFPEFSIFHGAILSFEVDSIKPHPDIYQHAIEKYSLIPENTLYIDDLPANIATGNQFGFKTHQYDLKNHAAFENWLSEQMSSTDH